MDLSLYIDEVPVVQAKIRRRSVEVEYRPEFHDTGSDEPTATSSWHLGTLRRGEPPAKSGSRNGGPRKSASGLSESTTDCTASWALKRELLSEWAGSERWESEVERSVCGSEDLSPRWADALSSRADTPLSRAETPEIDISPKKAHGLLCRRRKRNLTLDVAAAKSEASLSPLTEPENADFRSRYTIEEKLGQGATTVVYRACSRLDGRKVALKYMRMGDEEELVKHARSEYDVLKGIHHPHIIRALDFMRCPMGTVLVLELFEGSTLTATVEAAPARRLREVAARCLFRQLVSAVSHLHERGVVHRDVKGDNVLVSANLSDLRLADFNAARVALDGGSLTMTGTKEYMPPEVLCGESPGMGGDVWACGLCLYLMLQGSLPFQPSSFASHAHMGRAITSRGALRLGDWAETSEACLHVLRHALEVDPARRACAGQLAGCQWLLRCEESA